MSGVVLVDGVSFVNKGAELMLAAICDRARRASLEVAVFPQTGPFGERARYGLLQAFDRQSLGRLGPIVQAVMRPGYRKAFGLAAHSDIDAVLDASGYFLGDPWHALLPYDRKQRRFRELKRAGKPIVFLPQAFGPFDSEQMASAAGGLLSLADLVFARDETSLEHLRSVLPTHPGIRLAPDFTALLDGREPQTMALGAAPAAVIPNDQMLAHGNVGEEHYVRFLAGSMELLRRRGLDPFLLLHETARDRPIASKVQALAGEVPVIEESDPRSLKGIIGRCAVTIGSRFHGLVSALSQGVPSIGTGWSHKYKELFEDYGCPDCLVDIRSGSDDATDVISDILDRRESLQETLTERAHSIKYRINQMWSEVDQLLEQAASP